MKVRRNEGPVAKVRHQSHAESSGISLKQGFGGTERESILEIYHTVLSLCVSKVVLGLECRQKLCFSFFGGQTNMRAIHSLCDNELLLVYFNSIETNRPI